MTAKDGNPIVTARLSFSNWVALAALIIGTGGSIAIGTLKLWQDHEHRITVLEARSGIVRTLAPLLALVVLLAGCSAKTAISGAASAVQEMAHQTIELVQPAADGDAPLAQADAQAVVKLQRSIIAQAVTVQNRVVHVQDEPGFLDRLGGLLKWLAIAAAVLVAVWFLAPAARPVFAVVGGWIARLIPRRKKP